MVNGIPVTGSMVQAYTVCPRQGLAGFPADLPR